MAIQLDTIKVKGEFWSKLSPELAHLTIHSISKYIHFTVSNNPNSPYVNLHITRNFKNDEERIRIVEIRRDLLDKLANNIIARVCDTLLQPVNIALWIKRNPDLLFVYSVDEERMIQELHSSCIPYYKIRSRRLEVRPTLFNVAENTFSNSEFNKRFIRRSYRFNKSADWAFLPLKNSKIILKKINNRWYKVNSQMNIEQLLKTFIYPDTVDQIISNTMLAIKILTETSSVEEARSHQVIPIRLYENKSQPEVNQASYVSASRECFYQLSNSPVMLLLIVSFPSSL